MTDRQPRVAIVTGGNKGIGFQVCKELAAAGLKVILTARSPELGKAAAAQLTAKRLRVTFHRLDVQQAERIEQAAPFAQREFGCIDVLVNNAGICLDAGELVQDVQLQTVEHTLRTKLLRPPVDEPGSGAEYAAEQIWADRKRLERFGLHDLDGRRLSFVSDIKGRSEHAYPGHGVGAQRHEYQG